VSYAGCRGAVVKPVVIQTCTLLHQAGGKARAVASADSGTAILIITMATHLTLSHELPWLPERFTGHFLHTRNKEGLYPRKGTLVAFIVNEWIVELVFTISH